jgi:hypothetical protein
MNVPWLMNLSMAFDGTRFLSGNVEEPRVYEQAGFTLDASPLAGPEESTVGDFLPLARSAAIEGLELMCSDGVGLGLPAWQTDPQLNEFVLVTRGRETAWQLRSKFNTSIDEATHKFQGSWHHHFEVADLPGAVQLDAPEATGSLRALLAPHADNPWLDGAVGRALSILDGGELPEPELVNPWGVDDVRERLYYAASAVAGGKLSGMGGFDDLVTVDHKQIIFTFAHAFAASTRPAG